jgi:hypothetical protein
VLLFFPLGRTRAAHTVTQLRMSVSPHSSRRTFLGSAAVLAGSLFAGVEVHINILAFKIAGVK